MEGFISNVLNHRSVPGCGWIFCLIATRWRWFFCMFFIFFSLFVLLLLLLLCQSDTTVLLFDLNWRDVTTLWLTGGLSGGGEEGRRGRSKPTVLHAGCWDLLQLPLPSLKKVKWKITRSFNMHKTLHPKKDVKTGLEVLELDLKSPPVYYHFWWFSPCSVSAVSVSPG